jgi:hypothetical protein
VGLGFATHLQGGGDVTSTARDEPRFLMTPAQHREWARILHAKGKPEKARRHEELARAIEKLAQQR